MIVSSPGSASRSSAGFPSNTTFLPGGEAASVVTCIDGYQMAKKGRAGAAFGIAAIGSFIAGTAATFGMTFFARPLAAFALDFGPPEYFL